MARAEKTLTHGECLWSRHAHSACEEGISRGTEERDGKNNEILAKGQSGFPVRDGSMFIVTECEGALRLGGSECVISGNAARQSIASRDRF